MCERIKILVVDDDERERMLLETLITRMGDNYDVYAVSNGQEALRSLHNNAFHMLLTDLQMPMLDGVTITKEFLTTHPDGVVVWITAYGCYLHSERSRLPVYRCLNKPVGVDEIRQAVLGALKSAKVV